MLDVKDPYYGDNGDFEDVYTVIDASCPACTSGSTSGSPSGNRKLMRRWAFLLRPSWLALFVVVATFAYLCFTVLAPWQLGKNTKTSRRTRRSPTPRPPPRYR